MWSQSGVAPKVEPSGADVQEPASNSNQNKPGEKQMVQFDRSSKLAQQADPAQLDKPQEIVRKDGSLEVGEVWQKPAGKPGSWKVGEVWRKPIEGSGSSRSSLSVVSCSSIGLKKGWLSLNGTAKPPNAGNQLKSSGGSKQTDAALGRQTPEPATAAKKLRLAIKKEPELLNLDAVSCGQTEGARKSKARLLIDLEIDSAVGVTDQDQDPDQLQTAAERPKDDVNDSIEPSVSSEDNKDVLNLEDWTSAQEAFGAFYFRLRYEATFFELSLSDRVTNYVLKKDTPIRNLDVVFGETATLPLRTEVIKRYFFSFHLATILIV